MSKPDTAQELDYTHPDESPTVEHKPSPSSDLRGMIEHFTSEMLDNPNDYGIYPTGNFYNDLEEAIQKLVKEVIGLHVGQQLAPRTMKPYKNQRNRDAKVRDSLRVEQRQRAKERGLL